MKEFLINHWFDVIGTICWIYGFYKIYMRLFKKTPH